MISDRLHQLTGIQALNPNLVRVPADLASVIRRDEAAEQDPASVGVSSRDVERIWAAAVRLYRSGTQPFISLAVRRQGQCILKRSIGHLHGNGPADPAGTEAIIGTPDSPVCLFSASKAITATMVHVLAEQGHIDLDAPISHYVPEFAAHGKGDVTIALLLAHRAGIPRVPMRNPDPRILFDWDAAVQMLCAAKPLHSAGKQVAYHAVTGGFILGEVARRATGKPLTQLLDETLRTPMGFKYFTYGMDSSIHHELARDTFTGRKPPFPIGLLAKRALGSEFHKVPDVSTDPRFLNAVIPAGNICSTADEAAQFYAMLLAEGQWQGRQVMAPETVRRLIRPKGQRRFDRTLMIPVRFSEGMLLGDNPLGLYGRNSKNSFGHLGFINILTWADPDRQLSVSLLTSGKPAVSSHLLHMGRLVTAISKLPAV